MKKKLLFLGFGVIVIGIIALIYCNNSNKNIDDISYSNINKTVKEEETTVIYVSDGKEVPYLLKYFNKEYNSSVYTSKMSIEEVNVLLESSKLDKIEKLPIYLVYGEGKLMGTFESDLEEADANEMFRYYIFNEIPTSLNHLRTLSTGDEYVKKVNSNELTVAVFGYESCSFCNLYKPVINKVAGDNNLDVYYFDSRKYDQNEYQKIIDLDLTIPSSCTTTGKSTTMAAGFPKPMTLITKKGELVGCIKGYVTEEVLINKLKEFKVLGGK